MSRCSDGADEQEVMVPVSTSCLLHDSCTASNCCDLLWHHIAHIHRYSKVYKILHSVKRHTFRYMSGLLLEDLVKAVISVSPNVGVFIA